MKKTPRHMDNAEFQVIVKKGDKFDLYKSHASDASIYIRDAEFLGYTKCSSICSTGCESCKGYVRWRHKEHGTTHSNCLRSTFGDYVNIRVRVHHNHKLPDELFDL
jgi:hypothetical protein